LQKRDYQSAEAALRDFDQAIRLQPNHAKGYTSRAQAHFSRGEYDQVIQDCGQALRLGPDAEAYYWRGWCYLRRGEYWGAMPDFDQAIRLAPNMAGAYRGRGYIYAVRHQYDLAIQAYDRALRINPDASDYQSRGWVYYQKGEYISALGDYVQATRRQPSILLRWPWTWLVALALLAYLFLRRQSAKLAEINRPRDDEALTPPAVSGEDQRELVVAETFVHWHDAKLARALLESANIPAYLADEHSQAADGERARSAECGCLSRRRFWSRLAPFFTRGSPTRTWPRRQRKIPLDPLRQSPLQPRHEVQLWRGDPSCRSLP
jgi:tetratricopeptide (TPR) repeat protein